MFDKSDTNSSEKVIIEARIDKAYENLRSPVPIHINQNIAMELVSN
jgi:hypothetical protein